jgi:pseudouridine synthase
VDREALELLRGGLTLDDGPTAPAQARRLAAHELELTIHEGRNRQVRRMCAAIGRLVLALQRERFGPLQLQGLKTGEHRRLSERELSLLRAL